MQQHFHAIQFWSNPSDAAYAGEEVSQVPGAVLCCFWQWRCTHCILVVVAVQKPLCVFEHS